MIADGFGLRLSVSCGHLVIGDGVGQSRRERRLTRSQRTVRRILVLGHTGHLTLDAIRWCHDTGISLTVVERDGRILLLAGAAGRDDPRLRRAQAAAANSSVGLDIAKALLTAKIDGQATVTETLLGNHTTGQTLRRLAADLAASNGLIDTRAIEATASNVYFAAWAASARCRFADNIADRLPEHWTRFSVRRSPISRNSPRSAADPVNAMLNYSYALAEAECRLALIALGLDPGLGVVHTDAKNRDSLALDLLEPIRPLVEHHILRVTQQRRFTNLDFHETRTGACRMLPPLTHELAAAIPVYARSAGVFAEQITHALSRSAPGKIALTTPLSRANTINTQTRGARSAARREDAPVKVRRTCQQCGTDLFGSARKLCPTCWPVARNAHMRQLGLARAKPRPATPMTVDISGGITLQQYQEQILPGLAAVSLADIERATGLVNASCSRIKRGIQMPNPRYWTTLAALADVTPSGETLS